MKSITDIDKNTLGLSLYDHISTVVNCEIK